MVQIDFHMAFAVVILERKGKVLMQLRDNIPTILFPNHWGLFGGHVEENETPVECAIRELREELDYKIDEDKLRLFIKTKLNGKDLFVFRAQYPEDKEIIFNEGSAARFFSKEELKEIKIVPIIRDCFEKYFE